MADQQRSDRAVREQQQREEPDRALSLGFRLGNRQELEAKLESAHKRPKRKKILETKTQQSIAHAMGGVELKAVQHVLQQDNVEILDLPDGQERFPAQTIVKISQLVAYLTNPEEGRA